MRNPQDAEVIAERNAADRGRINALLQRMHDERMAGIAAAAIGPPKPIGSRIYPKPTHDWGLTKLRNRCYARLRAKRLKECDQ